MHLIIDGYDGDRALLSNVGVVHDFLWAFPESIEMKRIAPVQVVSLPNGENPFHGVSGTVMIATSHVALHTWPEARFMWADVFSCLDFDTEQVIRALVSAFGLRKVKTKVLERGIAQIPGLAHHLTPIGARR